MGRKRKPTRKAGKQPQRQSPSRHTHAAGLRRALDWFVQESDFTDVPLHGNVGWTVTRLVVLAVLWVWSDERTLTGAFGSAHNLAREAYGSAAVGTHQALTGALRSYTRQILLRLWPHLHQRMERAGGEHWRIGKWLALAYDGSRVSTPRTLSNEQAFSIKQYGQGKKTRARTSWKNKKRRSKKLSAPVKPQIWLTLIWHMGLKMPWCWKTGPSTASERQHLLEMLQSVVFPLNTLFCCDAGFVGYEFWSTLLSQGHSLLIRVGGNVRLLRNLGAARQYQDLVYLWPNEAMRKQQPPVVLRLIECQGPRGRVYLVTNVLSQRDLTLTQSRQLYRLRWGVELQFRAFKQTFGRRTLRSRTADNALVELDWSLVGLWLIQLFAVKEQIKIDSPPEQSSVALAMSAIQNAMRNWSEVIREPRALVHRLQQATKDGYLRSGDKRARYRPDSKDKPSATKHILIQAARAQRQAYKAILAAA
jgi:hypothetical protein